MKSRKANRLQERDYSRSGYYFVTVCTQNHFRCFGEIADERMQLSNTGMIVEDCWRAIPGHFPNTDIDEYIVMPNHIHGIVIIGGGSHSGRDAYMRPLQSKQENGDRSKMYLSKIIQGFKSAVTRVVGKRRDNYAFSWQRSFYDHVIRDDADMNRIRVYIRKQPREMGVRYVQPRKPNVDTGLRACPDEGEG